MNLSNRVRQGDARAVAKLITMVENDFQHAQKILQELHHYCGKAVVIGITGPPGSGKSTITDRLTKHVRKMGKKVGIIAIDPSSPFTGGAILGDRIRMQDLATDKEVFIRSIGTRGHLGGLSRSTQAIVKIMEAMGKNIIFIETVGVGQSEIEVIKVSDIILLVVMPGMGDDIQVIKAGIMEIGDIFVVNKADRDGADKLITEIEMMIHLSDNGKRNPSIIKTVGTENIGIDPLWKEIERLIIYLQNSGQMYQRRKNRIRKEIYDLFQENWQEMFFQFIGEENLEKEVEKVLKRDNDPYSVVQKLTEIFKGKIFKGGN
ncbi:MAG: methylmalonyl Co-A mutase-associated GTPase MeaB [Atribacterota bacterium]|nr:methylmalonyl Co-A mutase-associated GTPase MeaB [Atribacterota bacterium]MDD4896327.1 methylmalonyl Co-A mutase-associated GTPase MeaB [Atribacterota bacterium]MDD5638132.1 methylmalonyl Co-A mutase-associated GTPase MeaB [Atribacterota bacterium]